MSRIVSVSVPATSANLGPGYDALGLALEIRDQVTAQFTDDNLVTVVVTGEGAGKLPTDATHLIAKTIIGYGSKYQNTNMAHGSLIDKEVKYNNFEIPLDLLQIWRNAWKRNEPIYVKNIKKPKTDDLSIFFEQMKSDVFLDDSMRKIMGQILDKCYKKIPNLIGGSADLAISTCVKTDNCKDITADDFGGNFINYGAREHAMGAIINGITLYGDFIVFGSTFLVFADYMMPAIRMAALMKIKSIFIFYM